MNNLIKSLLAGTFVSISAGCAMQTQLQAQSQTTVQARFVPERADDFAFENDKVAFRVYGPALTESQENNGLDCWLKRVDYPIIDKWYKGDTQGISYHEDHGEGYDPYHVGSSLGCGSIGLWNKNSRSDDKLIQPNVYKSYKIIEKTADKAVFELEYDYPGNIHESKRITIVKGNQFFKAESQFSQNGKPVQLEVAVGVTTHDGKAKAHFNSKTNAVTTWETIKDSDVGTGVLLAKSQQARYVEQISQTADRSHALMVTSTDKMGKITYYAGFGWQKAGEINNFGEWQNYADQYLD